MWVCEGDRRGRGGVQDLPKIVWISTGIRERNDPRSGLASPNPTANLPVLVLGCIKADRCKQILILQHCQDIEDFHTSAPLQTQKLEKIY